MEQTKLTKRPAKADSDTRPFPGRTATTPRKPSQADTAVDFIRAKIIDLSIVPGSRIDERLLIEDFKLGRAPAREAINRLQAEGLVTIIPDRGGKYVRDLDLGEIGQVLTAHQVSESMLASLCDFQHHGLVPDLRRIQDRYVRCVHDRSYLEITEVNQQFHLRMCETMRNALLWEFARSIQRHVRRLLVMLYQIEAREPQVQAERFDENIAEHWAIIDAIHGPEVRRPADALMQAERPVSASHV